MKGSFTVTSHASALTSVHILQLLRTYGFVETSPYTSTLLTVKQVVAAASVFLCSQGGKALKEQAVTERLNALRKAGRLPIGDLFQLATTIPTSLLTLIQVCKCEIVFVRVCVRVRVRACAGETCQ